MTPLHTGRRWVALLAEGVDRNAVWVKTFLSLPLVALLAEGVDRNLQALPLPLLLLPSPSSRRAWIEIWLRLPSPAG